MLIGYARVSKADGSQSLDLQRDALRAEGIDAVNVYHDFASGVRDDRPAVVAGGAEPLADGTGVGLRRLGSGPAGAGDPPRLTPRVRLTPPTQTLDGRLTQAPTCEVCWQMLLEWAREDAELA